MRGLPGCRLTMTSALLCVCAAACLLGAARADPVTDPARLGLSPRVAQHRTDSMLIEWDEPRTGALGYQVQLSKSDSDDVITSPELGSGVLEYKVKNLVIESVYEICLKAATSDVSQDTARLVFNKQECITGATVDKIRRDSIIAVCIALGYILAMILLGYICWAITKRRIEANAAAREEELLAEEEAEEEKVMPAEVQPVRAPPPAAPPTTRSTIEDPDIPYITPPVSQLSKPDKDAYNKV